MLPAQRLALSCLTALALLGEFQVQTTGRTYGSLCGTVRDASTAAPLAGVRVQLFVSPASAVTYTDAEGRYSFRGVSPGLMEVAVESLSGARISRTFALDDGEDLKHADFRIPNPGRISGKVTDEDGKPLSHAVVYLVSREYFAGALRYVIAGMTNTGEKGNYVLDRISPGRSHLVLAVKSAAAAKPLDGEPEPPDLREKILAPTYYPGAQSARTAVPLVIAPGEVRESIDIGMRWARSYCMEGTARSSSGGQTPQIEIGETEPANISLTSALRLASYRADSQSPFLVSRPALYKTDPDGRFRVCGLHPGTYNLAASKLAGSSRAEWASVGVTIADRDLRDLAVVTHPSVGMPGEFVWGEGPMIEGFLTLHLSGVAFNVLISSSFQGNRFFIPRTLNGDEDCVLVVSEMPPGVYLKDITLGGATIRNRQFRPGVAPIRISLGRDGGRITVKIVDDEDAPVPEADAAVMPAIPDSEAALADVIMFGRTDQSGKWTSGLLAPGRYRVLGGFLPVDRSPEAIGKYWRALGGAKEIDVSPKATATAKLKPAGLD